MLDKEAQPTPVYHVETLQDHLHRIEAEFAVYRRETDVKLAEHHTELVSLRTQFHKLFDAMQHVGEPPFTMPEGDWSLNE
jgi:hypothetical protein